MLEDGDTVLNLVGVGLVVAVLLGLGVVALNFSPSDDGDVPDADWTVDRVNDTHVRIAHAGGDAVTDSELVVTVDGTPRTATWNGTAGAVTRGDSTVVHVRPNQVVGVSWEAGHTERQTLERWQM